MWGPFVPELGPHGCRWALQRGWQAVWGELWSCAELRKPGLLTGGALATEGDPSWASVPQEYLHLSTCSARQDKQEARAKAEKHSPVPPAAAKCPPPHLTRGEEASWVEEH